MPPPYAQLSALVALITSATKIVEEAYSQSEKPYVPSLDDTEPHPLDDSLDAELRTAIQTIEGACAQLCASVARPSHTIINKAMAFYEPNCLNIATRFKVPDVLKDAPEGLHISEIAKKTGLEERKASRILRLLATKHVFREVSDNVFANNRLSIQLLSDNPMSSSVLHFSDECHRANMLLPDILEDEEWGHSYAPNHTAYNKMTGWTRPMFFYVNEHPVGQKVGARFGIAMIGWGRACQAHNIVHYYPWRELGDGASVCDVGGGVGNVTLQLAKKYPTLQLKLQDLPETIRIAKEEVWPKECPEAISENRIQFEPIDFLKESPLPGCNIYYMRNIIHDWPDDACITIFSNIRKVMAPHSRILIHEYILQGANRVPDAESAFKQAPEPLLPNYGSGRIRQYNIDIDMMTMLNSEERRLPEFVKLGEAAGLRFEKLWDFGETGVVEFRLS